MSGASRTPGAPASRVGTGERELRKALSWVFDAGDPTLTVALAETDPESVWRDTVAGDLGGGAQRRAAAYHREALDLMTRRSATRFVVPGDDEWPAQLAGLADTATISDRGGVPVGLWVRGPGHLREWTERATAVVGARACTPYGHECATDLGAGLAEAGWTVVSGGAFGIDIAAHRGALTAGPHARTLAVLAGGPDIEYPRGNLLVLQRLAEEHLVVSEVPPGCRPTRIRFLARNRLIAGLSVGTVMVEAAARSGARNTMAWCEALGRVAMAVPGSAFSALSVGPHLLIKDQRAQLVTSSDEVLELVAPVGQHLTTPPRGSLTRLDALPPDLMATYEALPSRGYRTAGEVALATGVVVPVALAALSDLELQGLADPVDGGWRAVVVTDTA